MAGNNNQIENRLWAADELRANSKLKSSEYAVPVLGLVFLRYAGQKFSVVQKEIEGQGAGRRNIGPVPRPISGDITFNSRNPPRLGYISVMSPEYPSLG